MTRKEICELIQRRLAGGTPSNDFEPVLDEINKWLDFGVGQAAVQNYRDSTQIEVEYVGDAFYTTFKGIALTKDPDSGYWSGTLPTPPVGLPSGHDISSVYVAGVDRYSKPL